MPRRSAVVPILAAACALGACATGRTAAPPLVELAGVYTPGFETSRFVPCDARPDDRAWWVVLSADALRQRDALRARLPDAAAGTVYVRWRATLGPGAPTGHLGAYARWVHVAEIVALTATDAPEARECAAARAVWRGGGPRLTPPAAPRRAPARASCRSPRSARSSATAPSPRRR